MTLKDVKEFAEATEEATLVTVRVDGQDESGAPFWAFVKMTLDRYQDFLGQSGGGHLQDFGEILAHGTGREPPPEVLAQMRDEHGWRRTGE